jgi:hypothetical protein
MKRSKASRQENKKAPAPPVKASAKLSFPRNCDMLQLPRRLVQQELENLLASNVLPLNWS